MSQFDFYLPYALLGLKLLLIVLSVVFFLSGVDELFFDFVYLTRRLYRKLVILPKHEPLTEAKLLAVPEKLIAVMIPCWDESAVIRKMLTNTIRSVNYANYYIFVGTYPNDLDTQREVEIARESFDNVQRIVCPKDGPTNKADCLNWVYEGIKVFEKDHGLAFEIFVMNDSEDIVHPLYLKLFNYLIPAKDMVQLPVFPLPGAWWNLTRGHYLDEFAENHSKDMTVRELLSRSVPSAGVGSAYSRRALEVLAAETNNQLFNINSLTEDYDFGMRLGKHDFKQIFVRHAIQRTVKKRGLFGGIRQVVRREYIVIREFFPGTLKTAIRQKSRWVIGIALQGWASIGWQGGFWTRYMLLRDRKSLVTNQVNMLGNLLVPVIGGFWLWKTVHPEGYRYPPPSWRRKPPSGPCCSSTCSSWPGAWSGGWCTPRASTVPSRACSPSPGCSGAISSTSAPPCAPSACTRATSSPARSSPGTRPRTSTPARTNCAPTAAAWGTCSWTSATSPSSSWRRPWSARRAPGSRWAMCCSP